MELVKLSWRDMVNTVLGIAGAIILYAGIKHYSWWLVDSWRGAVLAMGVIGAAMSGISARDIENKSILNRVEVWLGSFAVLVVIAGLISGMEWLGVTLAITIGVLWLISTARHTRHSLMRDGFRMHHHSAYQH